MSRWHKYNANPQHRRVGDCTVRAISTALDEPWEDIYMDIASEGLEQNDMPTANNVWGKYLYKRGFRRKLIPDEFLGEYTVEDFCRDHPKGVYILALAGHVVTVIDGEYWDTWPSGDETPIFVWAREDE